jgi:hypothetical protein
LTINGELAMTEVLTIGSETDIRVGANRRHREVKERPLLFLQGNGLGVYGAARRHVFKLLSLQSKDWVLRQLCTSKLSLYFTNHYTNISRGFHEACPLLLLGPNTYNIPRLHRGILYMGCCMKHLKTF